MSVNVKMQGESHELVEQNQLKWTKLWSGNKFEWSWSDLELNDYPQNYGLLAFHCGENSSSTNTYWGYLFINPDYFGITQIIPLVPFGNYYWGQVNCVITKGSKTLTGGSYSWLTPNKANAPCQLKAIYGIKLGGVINRLLSLIRRRVVLA